jgi:Spy/CpxP family protein refolding chaperone
MKKRRRLAVLLAIVAATAAFSLATQAQIRPKPRLDPSQRDVNRPPFGVGQQGPNRPRNPNILKKQQLQQRVMQAIGLTPVQRARIQDIRRSHDDDVISAGRRVRLARQALDRAIMNENYSDAEVRKATEALAGAQADKIRLDATVRSQVRGVLTQEQVQRFHQLQREMRRDMREQQQKEQQERDGEQGLSNRPFLRLTDIDLADLLLSIVQ